MSGRLHDGNCCKSCWCTKRRDRRRAREWEAAVWQKVSVGQDPLAGQAGRNCSPLCSEGGMSAFWLHGKRSQAPCSFPSLPQTMPTPSATNANAARDSLLFSAHGVVVSRGTCRLGRSTRRRRSRFLIPLPQTMPAPSATNANASKDGPLASRVASPRRQAVRCRPRVLSSACRQTPKARRTRRPTRRRV